MCLFPKLLPNPKYKPNKKNGGRPPIAHDERVLKVATGCGICIECMRRKGREWRVRLHEEIRDNNHHAEFVTLTFSNESYTDLKNEILQNQAAEGYALDNAVAALATRRFLERYRKKFGVSPRHWFVTELGQENTEHLHIHGLIWNHIARHERMTVAHKQTLEFKKDIKELWQYGRAGLGEYVNERTVNYITKYVIKVDTLHKTYKPIILCSKGIGKNYTNRRDAEANKYKPKQTKETYTDRKGFRQILPMYYRNKIYTEQEREKLWLEKLDKKERYILGTRIDISKDEKRYYNEPKHAQYVNQCLGYGNPDDWQVQEYEAQRRTLKQASRDTRKDILYVDTETGEIFANPKKKIIDLHGLKRIYDDE